MTAECFWVTRATPLPYFILSAASSCILTTIHYCRLWQYIIAGYDNTLLQAMTIHNCRRWHYIIAGYDNRLMWSPIFKHKDHMWKERVKLERHTKSTCGSCAIFPSPVSCRNLYKNSCIDASTSSKQLSCVHLRVTTLVYTNLHWHVQLVYVHVG